MIQHNIRIQMTMKPPMIHYIVQYLDKDDRETPMFHDTVQYPDTEDRETPHDQ